MASVSTQLHCMVCDISVESADIRTHCGSLPHIDKCNRKYHDPHDRALQGGGGYGAYDKPCHNPETPSSSTITTGTRTISQPQFSSASSNTPTSDPSFTAPQDLRTRASTSRTLPKFPPAVPLGYFCAPCNTRVQFSAVREHLKSTEHTAKCKSMGLYCVLCQKLFLNHTGLTEHKEIAHKLPSQDPSTPGHYPCRGCPQTFPTEQQCNMHNRLCIPAVRLFMHFCTACNVEVAPEDAADHKSLEEHIKNSKSKDLYCYLCQLAFMGAPSLRSHRFTDAVHRAKERKADQSDERETMLAAPGTKFCSICDADYVSTTKDHLRTRRHIDARLENKPKQRDLYCTDCKLVFPTVRLRGIHHCRPDPSPASRPNAFHCCDCDTNFPTNSQFIKHLRKGCHLKEGAFKCDPCNLAFSTRKQLNLHLNSNTHRTLKCLGSTKCQRKFKNLAAMIQHLESGSCVSKLNRATIDGLVKSHDTAGAITIKDCPTPAMALTGLNEYHFNGSSPPALNAPVDQSEGSDDGSIILTPATVLTPVSAQSRRNSTASTSAVLTSTVSEFEFQLAKPQCNICGRTFASVTRLQMHIASPVHAVPIYHCPIDFLGELGLGGKEKNKKEKVFRTLSGLAQHIETGACRGGKQTWQKAIEFLEGKLAGFGLVGVKLLGQ